jgi:hypothetical protein
MAWDLRLSRWRGAVIGRLRAWAERRAPKPAMVPAE